MGGIDCAEVAYCDADGMTLEVVDTEWPPCDPTPIFCSEGCVGAPYSAVCAVRCGGTLCPVPPGMSQFGPTPCCTEAGACGFDNAAGCQRFDWPTATDPDCPNPAPGYIGCCLPNNVCGVFWSNDSLGCVDSAWSGVAASVDCDGQAIDLDAGLDAGVDG